MTATRPDDEPDPHPDSPPSEPGGTPERIDPVPDRKSAPVEEPGLPDGDEIMRVRERWNAGQSAGMKGL